MLCYEIVFGLVHVNYDDFFSHLSTRTRPQIISMSLCCVSSADGLCYARTAGPVDRVTVAKRSQYILKKCMSQEVFVVSVR